MIVTGVGNSCFEPERDITRAAFAAIVVRALGLAQGKAESNFGDVSMTDWFNGYVEKTAEYGLITGYSAVSYGPNDAITREQAMAIIARAMKIPHPASGIRKVRYLKNNIKIFGWSNELSQDRSVFRRKMLLVHANLSVRSNQHVIYVKVISC